MALSFTGKQFQTMQVVADELILGIIYAEPLI